MIARTWRGWTSADDAERYAQYVDETGVQGLAGTDGNRGVYILRRIEGDRAEFVVLSVKHRVFDGLTWGGPGTVVDSTCTVMGA